MTQSDIYVESDDLILSVDVQPVLIDTLENCAASAHQSAENAETSKNQAASLLSNIQSYKNNFEIFYAQAINTINSLSTDITSALNNLKNSIVQDITNIINTSKANFQTLVNSSKNSIQSLGSQIIGEARNYAQQAQSAVDFHVSTDHLRQCKALETGSVSTDSDVLPWIKHLAHSTFDSTKFTKVGSPIVTSDGIAGGFSDSNYLQIDTSSYTSATDIEIDIQFTTSSDVSTRQEVFGDNGVTPNFALLLRISTDGKFYIDLRDTSGEPLLYWNTSVTANTTYNMKFKLKDGIFYWYVNGIEINHLAVATPKVLGSLLRLGVSNNTIYPFLGSIDLKQLSITADGVPVFSGNKTGIDTVKPDNFTKVGTPTISADGIASGFTTSNYIETNSFTLGTKTWEMICEFKTESVLTGTPRIITSIKSASTNWYMSLGIWFGVSDSFSIRVVNDPNDANKMLKNIQAMPNTEYTVKIKYTGTQYIYVVNDNIVATFNETDPYVYASESSVMQLGGYHDSGHNIAGFGGSIDLNAFKIYVDGDLAYQSCLKIPYKETKTGSKVVNSLYRERVRDHYEQLGYAPYYTLDESNGDFTLPMGEIYGMLENLKKLIAQNS